eukprot:CAMPEP_0197241822 /NCGR_PEP_ID=MMETSP1429-20130617/7755_1 /TAXON_ID=49237 /ORGANISM="Chaetoceros  sp., Strain UNC1202" /LENGTH=61 /DNA_ID=CAMNT_0042701721 /DNA_START=12 /DNA_END=197 /DNA_ORIENTATION=-
MTIPPSETQDILRGMPSHDRMIFFKLENVGHDVDVDADGNDGDVDTGDDDDDGSEKHVMAT